jgi:hypothetical protein
VIAGKPHTFDWDTKRWSPDQAPAAAPAPSATPPAAVHFVEGKPTAEPSEDKQSALFQQANLLKRVQGDLSDLASIQSAFYDMHLWQIRLDACKMFAEIDRMDVTMLVILATFAPAFLCAQLLEFFYKKLRRMFFGRSRRCRFPKQYYLRCRILGQVAWSRKVNMLFLRRYLAIYVQYQVWIVRIHARKLKFLRKKPEEWSNDGEKADHPYDVQQEKLQRPMPHLVEALIHKMDPLGQYKNIKIITGPELLQSKKQKKAQKKACQSALTY